MPVIPPTELSSTPLTFVAAREGAVKKKEKRNAVKKFAVFIAYCLLRKYFLAAWAISMAIFSSRRIFPPLYSVCLLTKPVIIR